MPCGDMGALLPSAKKIKHCKKTAKQITAWWALRCAQCLFAVRLVSVFGVCLVGCAVRLVGCAVRLVGCAVHLVGCAVRLVCVWIAPDVRMYIRMRCALA